FFARIPPRERGNEIALLRERLAQRGQRRRELGQRRLLRGDVDMRNQAFVLAVAYFVERCRVDVDQIERDADLLAQRGFLDRHVDQVRGQRQIGRLHQKMLRVRLRL